MIEIGQLRFQEAPLVWLKGIASFLNTKLPVDYTELNFTAKSFEYPVCLLPVEIKNIIKKALRDVSESTVQLFFDYCLTVMANDMSKGNVLDTGMYTLMHTHIYIQNFNTCRAVRLQKTVIYTIYLFICLSMKGEEQEHFYITKQKEVRILQ